MRYTLMLVFASSEDPYVAWVSDGKSEHPVTVSLSNVRWFESPDDPTIAGLKPELTRWYGCRPIFKVVTEEELKAHVVLRTIRESTFGVPR